MDFVDKKLDEGMQSVVTLMVHQLTKMEEMQGMILDANFEAIRNNIVKIDKKIHNLNRGARRWDPDED